MAGTFWIGMGVSVACWFVADYATAMFLSGFEQTLATLLIAVLAGVVIMTMIRLRGLQSGKYEKSSWGVKRR